MSLSKTTAIVLKKLRLNEADNILTLITSEGSKISAVAKGIRKTKSKFAGRLEPFSVVDLVLYQGKTLFTVTQVNTVKDNKYLHDYDAYIVASAMGDLINQVAFEKGNDTALYDLFIKGLELIKTVEDKSWLLCVFDWKVLEVLGYSPNLSIKCNCYEDAYLDLSGDGIVCKKCRSSERQYVFIEKSSLNVVRRLMETEITRLTQNKEEYSSNLFKVTDQYLNYQLELKLKSRNLISY